MKNNHELKIEDLGISKQQANHIVKVLKDFVSTLGYSEDRISALDCRRRDGFIPYSHNKGGIACVAFRDQYIAQMEGTGFEKADETLEKYLYYDVQHFIEDKGFPANYKDWSESQLEEFDIYRLEDSDSSVCFGLDIMYLGQTGTTHRANLRFTVCVKDSPYHRQFDDLISVDIEWRFPKELDAKLIEILKREDIKQFSYNLEEAY